MKFKISFLLILLISLISSSMVGAKGGEAPSWLPLYEEESRLVYIDQNDFHSNLRQGLEAGEIYRVSFWIRQETLVPSSFFEYQLLVEKDKSTGIARFKILQSRFVDDAGQSLTAENQIGWARINSDEPMTPLIQKVWEYDESRQR